MTMIMMEIMILIILYELITVKLHIYNIYVFVIIMNTVVDQ
jgi:hypothetical protein